MKVYDVIIIGGGAAGFFAAIRIVESNPKLKVAILERGATCLEKVRISGGGRCNVTHAEFMPKSLSDNYPRGQKELLGPFNHFMTGDTMAWFEERGVLLKIEEDGRVFPQSDSSQSIIDCFIARVHDLNIDVLIKQSVTHMEIQDENWIVTTKNDGFQASHVLMATGSNPKIWQMLGTLGHQHINPVPSLFTFNCKDARIEALAGLSTEVSVRLWDREFLPLKDENDQVLIMDNLQGPLLITHWGFSGPAVLKLSAWAARALHTADYRFNLEINWLPEHTAESIFESLVELKMEKARQQVSSGSAFELPKRLWSKLVVAADIQDGTRWADLNKEQMISLAQQLTASIFEINGKSTFKEEFVTAGGIDLKEVDFKTFRSKLHKNLYFAGEILNIDAVTGGFNFQNAWTSAYLAAQDIAKTFENASVVNR